MTTYRHAMVECEITGLDLHARTDVNGSTWNGFTNWEIRLDDFKRWFEAYREEHGNEPDNEEFIEQVEETIHDTEHGHGGREPTDGYVPVGFGMCVCFWEKDADTATQEERSKADRRHAVAISREFGSRIQAALTRGEFRRLIELNKAEPDVLVCHSHDFVDANVYMHEAYTTVMNREPDLENQQALDLINRAWDLAMAADFYE